MDLSIYLIVSAFLFITALMVILNLMYIQKELYVSPPTFEYATLKWIRPRKNKYIQRFRELQCYTGWMTISFWLDIEKPTPYWRNIFHISESWKLEWNATNPANLPYDWDQDLCRRPAVFITPNAYGIHICHDTNNSLNNPFDIYIPKKSHITIVWRTDYNHPYLSVYCKAYVNGSDKRTFFYNTWLRQPDPDALLYMCDRFYGDGDFLVRDFKVFNYPLSAGQVQELYNDTNNNISTVINPINITGITIRHPNGSEWKNENGNLRLKRGSPMKISIQDHPNIYRNKDGRIGLLQDGNTNLAIRHSNFNMYTNTLATGNMDFSWYLIKTGDAVRIFNDYSKGYYVGYDEPSDRILIVPPSDNRIVSWIFDPMPSTEYIN